MVICAPKGAKWEDERIVKSIKPPYLFRAASDDPNNFTASRGLNKPNIIDPLLGSHYEYHDSLASIDSKMIEDHINYYYHLPSEFSSWSVSLLFVLQHAMRKAYALLEKNVMIYAMDTRTLPDARIHYAPDLLTHYDLGWKLYRDSETTLATYTEGEYLIRGRLVNEKGLWKVVMLEDLLPGIETVFPSLVASKGTNALFSRVRDIRLGYFSPGSMLEDIDPIAMDSILKMARRFGKGLEGAVALALFTTRKRKLSEDRLCRLRESLASIRLPKLSLPSDPQARLALRSIHEQWRGIEEAQQFMKLLQLLDDGGKKRTRADDAEDLSTIAKKRPPTLLELRTRRLIAYTNGRYG